MKQLAVRWSLIVLGLCSFCILTTPSWSADKDQSDIEKRIDNSAKVLDEIMGTPDRGIPDKIMSDAKCIAIIPSMVKIAVGFGGNHGKGVATCRLDKGRWSAVAPVTITGGSFGLQLGGQAIDLVMLVMNDDGMHNLLSSKFKIGGDASAAAGPVGRHAGADTDWKMKAQVLTYSRSRGLFAGIDLNGAVLAQDKDETRIIYGKFVPFDDILEGKVRRASMSQPFLRTVAKYTGEAKTEENQSVAQGKPVVKGKRVGHSETVTGCLQKGNDEAGAFSLAGEDGKIWSLRSNSISFDPIVGRQVKLTGSTSSTAAQAKEKTTKEGQVEQASSKEEYRDLHVVAITMISETCTK
jgi:lipid-binding SYLF domain-containing protein